MPRKRYSTEQIVTKLRQAEVELGRGLRTPQVCKKLGVSEQTYYRWRKEYGGLRLDQAKACIASLTVHASLVGESEHTAPKRRGRSTRGWKKLHFGVDGSGVIVADVLANGHVDDATARIALIEAVGGDVVSVTAHPANDTIAIYEAAGARGTTVVVPPTKAATATRYLLDKH